MDFITDRSSVDTSTITGNGAKLKAAVEQLVSLADELTIHSVNTDTEATYSVDISYKGITDWLIRFENSGSSIITKYLSLSGGVYTAQTTATYTSGYGNVIFAEISRLGSDVFAARLSSTSDGSGYIKAGFTCLRCIDQFTGVEKIAASAELSDAAGYFLEAFYFTENSAVCKCTLSRAVNGLTNNGLFVAIPVAVHTVDGSIPFSGFVGESPVLYMNYQGTKSNTFESRLIKFTLGGYNFVSLGENICVKVD